VAGGGAMPQNAEILEAVAGIARFIRGASY